MTKIDESREAITHDLKTDPDVFDDVAAGIKPFEIRKNDRDFRVGDKLRLMKTHHTGGEMAFGEPLIFTGDELIVPVIYILRGPIYGLMDGWVIMGIQESARDGHGAAVGADGLTTCNCRWNGDEQVQQCTLHAAHVEAIHDWATRAKTAEQQLAASDDSRRGCAPKSVAVAGDQTNQNAPATASVGLAATAVPATDASAAEKSEPFGWAHKDSRLGQIGINRSVISCERIGDYTIPLYEAPRGADAELLKDAERYRFIRDFELWMSGPLYDIWDELPTATPVEFDATIDAAIDAASGGGDEV